MIDFNELVRKRILPLLQHEGYNMAMECKNMIQLESSCMEIRFIFNDLEKSAYLYIGKRNDVLYSLENNIVEELLGNELLINYVSRDIFVENVVKLFGLGEMQQLLHGETDTLEHIIKQKSEQYVLKLFQEQILNEATLAWEHKDYIKYIQYIDKIKNQGILNSYLLKYRIAERNTRYCISVSEPWDFESQDGENIIKGHIVSMKSDHCIVFKCDHYLKFAAIAGYILVLTPRYKENDFSDLTQDSVVVNGGIFIGEYDEKLNEKELERNIKFAIIGSIKKMENSI